MSSVMADLDRRLSSPVGLQQGMMAVLLLPFLALVATVAGITTNSWTAVNRWRYGGFGSPFSSRARTIFGSVDRTEPWSPIWTDTGTVPDLLSQVRL